MVVLVIDRYERFAWLKYTVYEVDDVVVGCVLFQKIW